MPGFKFSFFGWSFSAGFNHEAAPHQNVPAPSHSVPAKSGSKASPGPDGSAPAFAQAASRREPVTQMEDALRRIGGMKEGLLARLREAEEIEEIYGPEYS